MIFLVGVSTSSFLQFFDTVGLVAKGHPTLKKCFATCPQRFSCRTTTTTVLRPFFRDHPGEPVPEGNFWTLWRKGRLTEANTPTIQLDATPSGLTNAHLHHPPISFTGQIPFLPPNQQCQSTEQVEE